MVKYAAAAAPDDPYNVVGMLKGFYAHARDRPRILA
jgi:hypothetical protein